jgi:hypothetical protein
MRIGKHLTILSGKSFTPQNKFELILFLVIHGVAFLVLLGILICSLTI